jgi:hypothetical protein
MLPTNEKLKYILGNPAQFLARPLQPFSNPIRALLIALSAQLIADPVTKTMPDLLSFAWFCRKASIERLAAEYADGVLRMGRGLALHITPTNMPVNFAFSWAFSLLAGNANIVRIPDRDFPQIPFLINHLSSLLEQESFAEIQAMNAFVTYGREEELTSALSAIADVRIIWGGDETIRTIRKSTLPARSLDIAFADRYSFCVLASARVLDLDHNSLARLASDFFNDAYTMDQNACSSPHLVIWAGNEPETTQAADRFWSELQVEVDQRYQLPAVSSVDKFAQACRDAIELDCVTELRRGDNRLYRLKLDSPFAGMESRRCHSGYLYEYSTETLDHVAPFVTGKYQTLTYFGLSSKELACFVARNRLSGIDRIVPVGKALDISLIWDGFDLIRTLSRVCDVREKVA